MNTAVNRTELPSHAGENQTDLDVARRLHVAAVEGVAKLELAHRQLRSPDQLKALAAAINRRQLLIDDLTRIMPVSRFATEASTQEPVSLDPSKVLSAAEEEALIAEAQRESASLYALIERCFDQKPGLALRELLKAYYGIIKLEGDTLQRLVPSIAASAA